MHIPSSSRFAVPAVALAVALLCVACLDRSQQSVLNELNHDRRTHGLAAVAGDLVYSSIAEAHARRMADRGSLYHSGTRIGRGVCALGENVGVGSSVGQVQDAFMASRAHRDITLTRRYDHAGVGAVWKAGRVWVVVIFLDRC